MTEVAENVTRTRTLSASSNYSESDLDPHFEPIIKLPEVKVSTNEEDEVVLLKLRARVYRFDTSNKDCAEWKERGTGEVKLLRHKENNSIRIVMRRDKTFKVCANHFITPWMELKPSAGTDKAFVYTVAADFADEEVKTECLAIKFGSVELASQFKEKFEEAKHIVKTQCKLYTDDDSDTSSDAECSAKELQNDETKDENATKEVTDKLSGLNVSKETSNERMNNEENATKEVTDKLSGLNVSKETSNERMNKEENAAKEVPDKVSGSNVSKETSNERMNNVCV